MPDLEAAIRTEAGHAKTDPSVLHEFRALRLNGGTSEVPEAVLIEAGTWARIEGDGRPDRAACVGLRPGDQRGHERDRRLLAGDRTP